MKRFSVIAVLVPLILLTVLAVYADYGREVFSVILRSGEILIVISLSAGLLKVLHKEFRKIKKDFFSQWSSGVILISFLLTFVAGAMNINQSKYTFSNIVREDPAYLVETADIIIGDDSYLSKFPARKKLGLYLASSVSPYFFPTDEMLREADMTSEDFKDLKYKKGVFSGSSTVFINEDDSKIVLELEKKVRSVSIEAVSVMLPVAAVLKEWFTNSIKVMNSSNASPEHTNQHDIRNTVIDGAEIKGSADMLKTWLMTKNPSGVDKEETVKYYPDFVRSSGIAEKVADSCSVKADMGVSKNTVSKLFSAFLKTGVTSSPNMKGLVRWIYRSVLDPLFSTFMAMLFFSMLFAAYRMLDFRNYSYFVISSAVCIVIAGFFPYFNPVVQALSGSGWKGPFSEGWMINVFAAPVFKALAIGTGTGVFYYSAETLFEIFVSEKRRGN